MQLDLEQLIVSQEDTRASLFPMPGSAKAIKMTAISGQRCLRLLKPSDPLGAFSKMLLVTFQWASTKCFLTWKVKGTPQGHTLFQLAPLMPHTDGIGSGLWQTPNANEDRAECYTLETSYRHKQEGRQIHLAQEVRDIRLWATPCAADHSNRTVHKKEWQLMLCRQVHNPEFWPTATARDYRSPHSANSEAFKARLIHPRGVNLVEEMQRRGERGALNPTWVEWFMGYPSGWTDLNHSEIQSSPKYPKSSATQSSKQRRGNR